MREPIKLSLKSSTPGKYYAVTLHAGAPLRLSCACAAGDNGMLCKHVLAVLNADAALLAEHNPPEIWEAALAAIAASDLAQSLADYQAQSSDLDQRLAALKKEQKALKHAFARKITGIAT